MDQRYGDNEQLCLNFRPRIEDLYLTSMGNHGVTDVKACSGVNTKLQKPVSVWALKSPEVMLLTAWLWMNGYVCTSTKSLNANTQT